MKKHKRIIDTDNQKAESEHLHGLCRRKEFCRRYKGEEEEDR